MTCPNCGRRASWARTRCPACRTKLITWYLIAAIIIAGASLAALLIMEMFG